MRYGRIVFRTKWFFHSTIAISRNRTVIFNENCVPRKITELLSETFFEYRRRFRRCFSVVLNGPPCRLFEEMQTDKTI